MFSDKIKNQITGQTIAFRNQPSTQDKVLLMESSYPAFSKEPPLHFHPRQREAFKILKGALSVRINGNQRILQEGDEIEILPKQQHAMWNASNAECTVIWEVYPALDTKAFLKKLFELANKGETNLKGVPNMMMAMYLLKKHQDTFRVAKMPISLVYILYYLLYPAIWLKRILAKRNQ